MKQNIILTVTTPQGYHNYDTTFHHNNPNVHITKVDMTLQRLPKEG